MMVSKTCRISPLKMSENTGNIRRYTHIYAEIALEEACFAGDVPFLSPRAGGTRGERTGNRKAPPSEGAPSAGGARQQKAVPLPGAMAFNGRGPREAGRSGFEGKCFGSGIRSAFVVLGEDGYDNTIFSAALALIMNRRTIMGLIRC